MRLRMAAAAVALMAAGCGTSSDEVLAEQFDTISVEGCEAKVAHTAKQHVSGAGQAEASPRAISSSHVLVAAVNEEYVGELPPGRLLRAAERDLGLDAGSPGRPRHR